MWQKIWHIFLTIFRVLCKALKFSYLLHGSIYIYIILCDYWRWPGSDILNLFFFPLKTLKTCKKYSGQSLALALHYETTLSVEVREFKSSPSPAPSPLPNVAFNTKISDNKYTLQWRINKNMNLNIFT